MFWFRYIVIVFFSISLIPISSAAYTISGKVNLSESWQRQIFLSKVDRLDDYYKADPTNIINVSIINEDGSFEITGDNLPDEERYYRLYLIKEENSEFDACLYVGGDDHNYVYVILDNNTQLSLDADSTYVAPFGNYTVTGNTSNVLMRDLNRLVHPSYYFYQIKFPSELQFSQDKLNRDLFNFADTCSHDLVALAAVINTDMLQNFEAKSGFYYDFVERLKNAKDPHIYAEDYYRKLRYYDQSSHNQSSTNSWKYIAYIFMLLSAALSYLLFVKGKNIADIKIKPSSKYEETKLTNQEQRILNLIVDGKSNKEIAAELYIGLSTVKTHINKLYAKIKATDRASAINWAKRN